MKVRTDKNIYIIAGCNGAGKTTASYNILPEILDCKEFVNADEIARGLSPFQPERVAFEAGRLMLLRIEELMKMEMDFAIETTLATKIYVQKIQRAQAEGYTVSLLFFWLPTADMAKERVRLRVSEGGHHIADDVIERRYISGIKNLFGLYMPICDSMTLFDNSDEIPILVMKKSSRGIQIFDEPVFDKIKNQL